MKINYRVTKEVIYIFCMFSQHIAIFYFNFHLQINC